MHANRCNVRKYSVIITCPSMLDKLDTTAKAAKPNTTNSTNPTNPTNETISAHRVVQNACLPPTGYERYTDNRGESAHPINAPKRVDLETVVID